MNNELRILLLEDVETDAQIIEDQLREAGLEFSARRVVTREEYAQALVDFSPDIVLADNSLPAFDAHGALRIAHEINPLLPVVVVTGSLIDEKAVELLREGASDYVLKDRLARLAPAVRRALAEAGEARKRNAMVTSLQESEERYRLLFTSSHDGFMTFEPPEWRFTSCNPAAVAMFGATDAAQLIGRSPWELSPEYQPDGQPSAEKARFTIEAAMRDGGHYFEWTHQRFDGSAFDSTVLLTRLTLNGKSLLNASIRDTTERKRARVAVHEALIATIEAIASTMETRDPYTAGHQKRVARLAAAIAREMGLDESTIEGIHFGAQIHDLGKIQVPAEILAKPGRLSPIEFEIIKTHPQAGYDIVKGIKFPWPVVDMVHQHHERLDGSGYPQGLKGDAITLEARIVAVADVVEAMSSHRPYRAGLGLDKALAEISKEAGTHYDQQAVDACLRLFNEKGYQMPE